MEREDKKILILKGKPGCAKNTLIDVYCKEHNIEVIRFTNPKMSNDNDLMGGQNPLESETDEFAQLTNFIHSNCRKGIRRGQDGDAQKKSMFKAFKTKLTLDSKKAPRGKGKRIPRRSTTSSSTSKFDGRVAVLNGLPLSLTEYSYRRKHMLETFNEQLKLLCKDKNTNLLIITLNDDRQMTKKFLSDTFCSEVRNHPGFEVLMLNPVIDKSIKKILESICQGQGIYLESDKIMDIVNSCDKDLHHAIVTLELYSKGNSVISSSMNGFASQSTEFGQFKSKKGRNKRAKPLIKSQSEFFDSSDSNTQSKKSKQEKVKNQDKKDYGLSIFHAMGKFLYNKRIDPVTSKARVMTFEELNVPKKPKFYESHSDILSNVQTESHTFSLFLQENMYDFCTDIEDVAKIMDMYSFNDSIQAPTVYSYSNKMYYDDLKEQASLCETMAITEYNLHPISDKSRGMRKFTKPQYFDFIKKVRECKQKLEDSARLEQKFYGEIISEDFLLGNLTFLAKEYLGYLLQLGIIAKGTPWEGLSRMANYNSRLCGNTSLSVDEHELVNDEKDIQYNLEMDRRKAFALRQDKKKNLKDKVGNVSVSKTKKPEPKTTSSPSLSILEEAIEDDSEELNLDEIDLDDDELEGVMSDIANELSD